MNASEVYQAALLYLEAGYSVIPTRPGEKRPYIPWKQFQARRAAHAEMRAWYRDYARAGVAIVCGAVSGAVVVDGDPRNGNGLAALAPHLPPTPTVETGGGGRHYYFRLPLGPRLSKVPSLLPGVDFQAEASCVMAPPSIHPSGRPYRWLYGLALGEVPLAPLPVVVRHLLAMHHRPAESAEIPRQARGGGLSLQSALARLEAVHRSGRGWLARCPCHEDREPSLSVGEGDAGRLLIHCFAGCTFGDVVRALGDRRSAA